MIRNTRLPNSLLNGLPDFSKDLRLTILDLLSIANIDCKVNLYLMDCILCFHQCVHTSLSPLLESKTFVPGLELAEMTTLGN